MAQEILTRCGYRCDLCHAYKENIKSNDKRQMLSEGWNRIFGIELEADEIYCEGCISSKNNDIKLIDSNCGVRHCVTNRGYENCSQCDKFACEVLEEKIVKYENFKADGKKISRSDRKNFIKPYENFDRLIRLKEKSGLHSRMCNKLLKPFEEDMIKFIEDKEKAAMWKQLQNYIHKNYNFNKIVRYGGKNYGWYINFKYGTRSILTIYPERNSFTVLFVFGKKELEEWEEVKEQISLKTNEIISNTKQYHDGKWIWLKHIDNDQLNDCFKLLNIKRKIKK